MDPRLGYNSRIPGFRFRPSDVELLMYYLKRKVTGKSICSRTMPELDVFHFAPWELPGKAVLKSNDLMWYFISPRFKRYPDAPLVYRATKHGYWKSTGTDRIVKYQDRPVGKIKTLIFHRRTSTKPERTDWVMHEYKLTDVQLLDKGVPLESFVITKVFEKSGIGPKNGATYGAPFVEEEWYSDDDNLGLEPGIVADDNATHVELETDIAPDDNVIHVDHTRPTTDHPLPSIEIDKDEFDLVPFSTDGEDLADLAGYIPVCPTTRQQLSQSLHDIDEEVLDMILALNEDVTPIGPTRPTAGWTNEDEVCRILELDTSIAADGNATHVDHMTPTTNHPLPSTEIDKDEFDLMVPVSTDREDLADLAGYIPVCPTTAQQLSQSPHDIDGEVLDMMPALNEYVTLVGPTRPTAGRPLPSIETNEDEVSRILADFAGCIPEGSRIGQQLSQALKRSLT